MKSPKNVVFMRKRQRVLKWINNNLTIILFILIKLLLCLKNFD